MATGGLSKTDVGNSAVIGGIALEFYSNNGYNSSNPIFDNEPHVALRLLHTLVQEVNVSGKISVQYGLSLKDVVLNDNGTIYSIV